ncbi:MAG TPA: hypothetical protein VFZ58_05955 [Candidatus Saccharimonadales bacterium]
MPEVLQPPSEGPVAVLASYFAEIPRLSADDYSFESRILEIILSLKAVDLLNDEEEVRETLEIPIDLLQAADRFENEEIRGMIYSFANKAAMLVGEVVIDKRSALGNYYARFNLLQTAQQAVAHLTACYPPDSKNLTSTSLYSDIYRSALNKTLRKGIESSREDAYCIRERNLQEDQQLAAFNQADYEAVTHAIFLIDAGAKNYLSQFGAQILRTAWSLTQYDSLITPRDTPSSLHKEEN